MTEDNFLTYFKTSNKEGITELTNLLTAHEIEFQLEDASTNFDPSFANNEFSKEYRVKLQQHDFDKVDHLLLEDSVKKLDEIDTDYYLFGFSNDELLDLIAKSDEWSKLDYLLAQKILRDRGQGLSEEELEAIKMERIAELSKPEENQQKRIVAGYVFAVLGGFVGMFIGWHLLTHKKTLPNGDSVFAYVPKDRKQGRIIFILGSIFLVVGLLAKILIN